MKETVNSVEQPEKPAGILARILSTAGTAVILAIAVFVIYAAFSSDNKSVLGHRMFIVRSGSMMDFIMPGVLLITGEVDRADITVGDVITFISSDPAILGEPNTHRVTRIVDGKFYTQGDANDDEDLYPVEYASILGRRVFHSRIMGAIVRFLSKPVNMLLFLVLPTILLTFVDFGKAVRKIMALIREDKDTAGDLPETKNGESIAAGDAEKSSELLAEETGGCPDDIPKIDLDSIDGEEPENGESGQNHL